MKKNIFIVMFFLSFTSFMPLHAQWARTYGGYDGEDAPSIQQTNDGGYVVAGKTTSFGVNAKLWVLKLDSIGAIEWQKIYGKYDRTYYTSTDTWAESIQQTTDGGYIVAGCNTYTDGDYQRRDIWILKLDSAGAIEWQKIYDGENGGYVQRYSAYSIQQTVDGGYVIVGLAGSRIVILKLYSNGAIEWQKNIYGGNGAYSIQQTYDGGYIVVCRTFSYSAGLDNIWILKLDSAGEIEWQRTYGGNNNDGAGSILQTSDGGYIVAGGTSSFGAGMNDIWILKLDSDGEIEWQKTYGNELNDSARSIQQTSDGGYIVAGDTYSFYPFSSDIRILKLLSNGEIEWQKTYGGEAIVCAESIQLTSDGGYIVAGNTKPFGAEGFDILILKLDSTGNIGSSCELVGSSSATVSDTFISPEDTNITPENSNFTPLETDIVPQDTNAIVYTLCGEPLEFVLTISTTTGGTTDPVPDTYTHNEGEEVTINAISNTGYKFVKWSGDASGTTNPITITMQGNKLITANFIREYSLTISAGNGGTTNPSPDSYIHDDGTQVSITAVPDSGYQFSGWSGDATGTANPITITMDSNKSITANFTATDEDGKGDGCFIATAAYGSTFHPYVEILREFRDRYLMSNKLGRKFVNLYYKYSPLIADLIAKHKPLRVIVQINLIPFVVFSYSMVHLGPVVTGGILLLIFMLQIFLISILYKDRRSGS